MSITLGNSPQLPNPLLQPDPNQASGPTSAPLLSSTVLPPVSSYLALPFSRAVFETLGLDLPRNPDDVAALLADVSLTLDKVMTVARNNREVAIAQHRSAAFTAFGAIIGSMAQNRVEWAALDKSQKDTEAHKQSATDQRDALIATRDSLQGQIDGKNSQIGSLNGTIGAQNIQIAGLSAQIAVAAAAGNGALVTTLTAQRAGVMSARDSNQNTVNQLTQQRDSLVQQKATADQTIQSLNAAIAKDDQDIQSYKNQKLDKDNDYFLTQRTMLNVFTLQTLFLAGLSPINALRDFERDLGITLLFETLADRLGGSGNLFDISFGPLSFLDQIRLTAAVDRIAQAFGFDVEHNRLSSLLNTLGLGQSNQTTVLGLVLEASILNLSFDQLRDADVRGLLISGALGLVAGLADAVTTLAALDLLVNLDLAELGVSDGLRLRLSI